MITIFFDGHYLKTSTQTLEPFTPGVFRAKGVFETMLGLDSVVLDIALHFRRLHQGLKFLKIPPPLIDRSIFKKLLVANKLSCARVRLLVWREGSVVHVMIAALPYRIPSKKNYSVCLFKTSRIASTRLANVKSLDYELFAKAYKHAQIRGFDEALLLNQNGHIFEASRANIFWCKDKILYTPPLASGCLNGITRRQVIHQARMLKVPVKERDLTPEILKKADTAFLTNSLIGIKPIEKTGIGQSP